MHNTAALTAESFWERAAAQGLLAEGDFIVAAVSGGADSSALLHLLNSLKKDKNLSLLCAHVNHNLRGEESKRDENFVRGLCEKYGVPIRVLSADVAAFAAENRLSTEEAGRELRYRFFEDCAEGLSPAAKIATAHNLSDCVETFIFNAARGTSIEGLCGIPTRRGRIIRPLLGFSREETERYCAENGIDFVTDSTNLENEYTRNKIRHGVAPVLKEVNPEYEHAFRRLFESLKESRDFIEDTAMAALADAKTENGYDAAILAKAPEAVKKRAAAEILKEFGFERSFERVAWLAESFGGGGFKAELSKGAYLVQRDGLIFRGVQRTPPPLIEERDFTAGSFVLTPEKEAEIFLLSIEEFKNSHKVNHYDLKCTFDYGKIIGKAVVRSRRVGDKIDLHGGTKTLKKLFIEKNIPLEERCSRAVIADGAGVLWVEGLGAARRARLSEKTKTVAVIKTRRRKNFDAKDAAK